jgi:hypothetical protein
MFCLTVTGGWANRFSATGPVEASTPQEKVLSDTIQKLTVQLDKMQKDHAEQLKQNEAERQQWIEKIEKETLRQRTELQQQKQVDRTRPKSRIY